MYTKERKRVWSFMREEYSSKKKDDDEREMNARASKWNAVDEQRVGGIM